MAIRYVLSDIEGTSTSVSFVYDVLFPYFLAHISELDCEDEAVCAQLALVQETVRAEEQRELSSQEALQQLVLWTKNDRKHPALKNLQGMVWRKAYEQGQIQGHVYEDVPPVLQSWKQQSIDIGIYSSGSVAAQKLLFGYSIYGNLLPLFSHHFDTAVGHKRQSSSYQEIAKQLGIEAQSILFLSDVGEELDAAAQAGMQTWQLLRRGNTAPPSKKHRQAYDFYELVL